MENIEYYEYPELLDVKDIQSILQIGRRQAYELVNSNVFHSVKFGRRIKIPKQSFFKWLKG
ncbi:helix-turn-helix domain-containing protein [Schinkia azotoformans]|uniref:helix-turn-helix domain-containing protein n=1 Tax=Schinkia azotoformans TaxID=1454 RepID=UPI002DB9BEE5|nr:helix-turn-helix domain-containing protein [Schinkia azotoformans]MEC1778327.1 helix-turn-helix domain-containing protein [Schinkia azotoformans]MED4331966.1 helix-turn-helix domain-containing protein [Schinkia azotoformans]